MILCLLITLSATPAIAFADCLNDLELGPEMILDLPCVDAVTAAYQGDGVVTDDNIYGSAQDAAVALRNALLSRQGSITLSWKIEPQTGEDIDWFIIKDAKRVYAYSLEHTGNPYGGIILKNSTQVKGAMTASYTTYRSWYEQDGDIIAVGRFDLYYVYSASQDALFRQRSDEAVALMQLEGKTPYEKICAVYGYVINHARYRNAANGAKAYGPLVEGYGNCDGVSQLVYHLMLRAGINCRYIVGYSGAGSDSALHAWNIVELNGLWYNVDATFDLRGNPASPYYDTMDITGVRWLLKSDYSFRYDRNGNEYHGKVNGYEYYEGFVRALTDYGEELLCAGEKYRLVLSPGEEKTFIFIPKKTSLFSLKALRSSAAINVTADTYFYSDRPVEEADENTIDQVFNLQKGKRYIFKVSAAEPEASFSGVVGIVETLFSAKKIIGVKCMPVYYSETDLFQTTDDTGIKGIASIPVYDVEPKFISVLLDDGTVIEGNFDKVLTIFRDKFNYEVRYWIEGDDQMKAPWREGSHTCVLHFAEQTAKYDVVIKRNSYKERKEFKEVPIAVPLP